MGQLPSSCCSSCRLAFLGLLKRTVPRSHGAPTPAGAPIRRLLLALVLHAFHLIPVRVLLQVALSAAARAEPEGQVVALLGPHVLPALLLVPGTGAANAVELNEDGALPLKEALQMHPVAIRAELVVAEHSLVVVFLQVDGASQTAAQRGGTLGLAGALRPGRSGGCSRRGRASCRCRTPSIFLLVSAAVRAFALLPLAALLVGHFRRIGTSAAGISTSLSISGCCQRRLAFLWTPFLRRTSTVRLQRFLFALALKLDGLSHCRAGALWYLQQVEEISCYNL